MTETTSFPSGPEEQPPAAAPGPIVQSAAIGFRVIYLVTLLLGALWLGSNFRIISSDNQAVVMQFGRIVHTQKAGLLLAWPRPIEEVRLLPGPDRQLTRQIGALPAVGGIVDASSDAGGPAIPATATPYLTGDGAVVMLDATLVYRIKDPAAFVLSQAHVRPAMDRIFRAAAVQVAAGQGLNDFLVAQTTGDEQTIEAVRGVVRERLLNGMNRRLNALDAQGAGLGIEIERIDLTALLPPQAKALERTVSANVDTTSIVAIERAPGARDGLEQQAYRNGIGAVLGKAGAVIVVDPTSGQRIWMSGPAVAVPPR